METTLILLKPDAVARGVCGQIISRFERRGLKIVAVKMLSLSEDMAKLHYCEHVDKPFFPAIAAYITSGPVIAIALSGENIISMVRKMVGTTDAANALAGTIRGDFAVSIRQNVIHASDSPESAQRELAIFFAKSEIMGEDNNI